MKTRRQFLELGALAALAGCATTPCGGEKPLAFAVVLEHGGNGLKQASKVANTILQKAVELDP